ncbi:hypothetical protein FB567DRAFT_321978 [Paraphoma chrysanthemicola]|uniref:Zn(2)-C6 fungal-type domain-containing protein n=1 Tax=Paraphoma chrysanthemicola TaxID=798071 RepID=A0A8K0RAV1_9PLEO|nr:hypothetical protein FB567DRAFT_321978 [Paraphoma chrysanthemicola]
MDTTEPRSASLHNSLRATPSTFHILIMTEQARKRKRVAISCTLCRKRKIRCNRATPCSNCVRSRNATCLYETEAPRMLSVNIAPAPMWDSRSVASNAMTPSSTTSTTSIELESMKRRIKDLEALLSRTNIESNHITRVQSGNSQQIDEAGSWLPKNYHVVQHQSKSTAPTHAVRVTSGLAGPIDILEDDRWSQKAPVARGIAHKNRVFGQSHWMNGFVVFKDLIELLEPQMRLSKTLLPGLHRAKALARVIKTRRSPEWPTPSIAGLPPRSVCDDLVAHYFRNLETLYRVLHRPTFQETYNQMWVIESSTPFMMQVKLVLAIGAITYDKSCSMRADATRWIYEAQTWIAKPTIKSRLGVEYLQTSILLLLARELVDVGSELVWISAGALLREAMYIGLHKDPMQLPRSSHFEREMRRRLWNTILEINAQFSLISGGSCLITMNDFTTTPPGNFNDEDLCTADATPATDEVFTDSSVAIALRRTLPIRLHVVCFLNDAATLGTYDETLRIDADLRAASKSLRQAIQPQSCSSGATGGFTSSFALEATEFIMQRYISSLHIPYLNPSFSEAAYAYSRKAVLDTSLKIWNLACPSSESISDRTGLLDGIETDMARICRCGAGFFRAFTFHASTFLAVELRAQYQDEDNVPRPDLLRIPNDAADLVIQCIDAGETGIKGYLLLRVLEAQIDAIKKRVPKEETIVLLGKAAENAISDCLPLLERIAGIQDSSTEDSINPAKFDFQVSPDFMEDWDLVMSDVFDFEAITI